jgi:diguanylate cyclase (GGDEF)-like protein
MITPNISEQPAGDLPIIAGLGLVPPRKPKLLVVDDQPINIQTLHNTFADEYDVFMATNGAQALVVCAKQLPDLVLLDIEMPDMDGFEVCKRLKADSLTQSIPVIFITAHSSVQVETRGLELGAVDFISKPINPQIVRARVKTHVTLKMQADLLRRWVYLDGLTNVYNRRYFDEYLSTEWNRACRNGTELSILMIDVDFFKRYNDHYGHQEGDNCLRRIAHNIKVTLKRPGDFVARYGGEEFVCVLPETDLKGALLLAEQIRNHVISLQIEHTVSAILPTVTVSLGACSKPKGSPKILADFLHTADLLLYRAKALGRNQSCGETL